MKRWPPKKIRARLVEKGITMAAIARKLGVSITFVWQVVNGIRPTPYVRQAIAEAIGADYEKVWGEEDGHGK